MTVRDDRLEISRHLKIMADFFGKALEPSSIVWMTDLLLSKFPAADILVACANYILDKNSKGFPFPGQLIELIKQNKGISEDPEAESRIAVSLIIAAMSKYGWPSPEKAKTYIGSLGWKIVESEGGWAQICATTKTDQLPILKAQWRELGIALCARAKAGLLDKAPQLPESDKKLPPKTDNSNLVRISDLVKF